MTTKDAKIGTVLSFSALSAHPKKYALIHKIQLLNLWLGKASGLTIGDLSHLEICLVRNETNNTLDRIRESHNKEFKCWKQKDRGIS